MARYPSKHQEEIPAKRLANQLSSKTATQKRAGMNAAAHELQGAIKLTTPVDTGELQRSVTVRAVVQTPNPRFVVETAQHGLFVEHGTRNMLARPFIRNTSAHTRSAWEAAGREAAASKKGKK